MIKICQYKSIAISKVFITLLACSILAITSIMTSCSQEENSGLDNETKKIKVQFYTTNQSITRQTSVEAQIAEVEALVFIDNGEGYKYIYSASGTSLTNSDNLSATFDLEVYTEARPVKIYILANSNDAILNNPPMAGDSENEVKEKLTIPVTSTNITGNFPMWGEYLLPSGILATLNNTVIQLNVLRAIARIDIQNSTPSNFTMTSIQAFRVNTQMQIIPDSYTGQLLVSDPSIPATSTATVTTSAIPVTGNNSEAQLYLPESEAPALANQISAATCLVVGGRYNGSTTETYYRIDFAPDISGYPLGQILRNHHYTFDIQDVTSAGWPTPEDAANNRSSNITTAVMDWTDKSMYINEGGTNRVFLSDNDIFVDRDVNAIGSVYFLTNITDRTIQWGDASGNPIGEKATSLNNGIFQVTMSAVTINVRALQENPQGNGIREQYIVITAGRLQIPVKITQFDT